MNISIDASSIMTVVSFLTFVGILVWTYVIHRGSDFDTAARTPFADEEDMEKEEHSHV
ncbi:MAG: CcoQ/FixQ family Cbb3-type cytochrome c oxidase assembly chaperone [Herminiimonas sp.]|uniref:cbb3-type cytochrome oxidase subunit 3 n=1 Tax=Herminiimonas sp. TaxID=1926289 RepID=UPI00271DB764|nr:CcoQ/FixQ family Cbb3-type cytochrome c oxidase assembly chaperone [Herminiimonas sp.]MDO9420917.1 CcoQ/FixQ family Cbb3-type cytochrome c oxidase assembly chaperone [Herminiimonas sp.]